MLIPKKILALLLNLILLSSSITVSWGEVHRIKYKKNSYDVFRVNPAKQNIQLYWKNGQGKRYYSFQKLKNDLHSRGRKLTFATNAGIFEWGYRPLGLYIERGKRIERLNRKSGKGNFYVKPNGVFYITRKGAGVLSTRHYAKAKLKPLYATQSGPLLVRRNIMHRRFTSRSLSKKIRNGVGIDRKGRIVFVISRGRVNMFRFAEFFKKRMKCANALYLDGNISKMYLPAINRYDLGGSFAVIIGVSEKIIKKPKRVKYKTKEW